MPLDENLRAITYMLRHDPLIVSGLAFLGFGGVLSFHILLKLNRAKRFGVRDWRPDSSFKLPWQYLQVCEEKGWTRWPAYLTFPCYIFGFILLVVGLLQWGK